jgi:YVTN family beta-propeller protein
MMMSKKIVSAFGKGVLSAAVAVLGLASMGEAAQIWVTNQGSNTISIIDSDTHKVTDTFPAAGWKPHYVTFTPDGKEAWVSNVGSNNVVVFDTAKKEVKAVRLGP